MANGVFDGSQFDVPLFDDTGGTAGTPGTVLQAVVTLEVVMPPSVTLTIEL